MDNCEERIKKIEQRLDKIEELLNQVEQPRISRSTKKISVKEFLIEKNPKSEIETTFYLAYFLEKISLKESFGIEDLRKLFKSAKTPLPKNINDTVNKNIGKGYFMEVDKEMGAKRWVLTITGENHAEEPK